jgi:hypothetical protein
LRWARLITIDGVEHWEMPVYPKIDPAPDDSRHVVDQNDRIDKLALRFYGDMGLWWILAIANDLELLPDNMHANQVLKVPSQKRVFSEILRRPSGGVEGR